MDPLKELYALAHKDACARHPKISPACVPTEKYKVKTANGLTKAVIKWIRLHGGQAERISVTGRMVDNRETYTDVLGRRCQMGSTQWIPGTMTSGSADISSIIRSHAGVVIPWKIEIKIGRDRQSEKQKAYEAEVKGAGGHYSLVHTFEEFYQQYMELMGTPRTGGV